MARRAFNPDVGSSRLGFGDESSLDYGYQNRSDDSLYERGRDYDHHQRHRYDGRFVDEHIRTLIITIRNYYDDRRSNKSPKSQGSSRYRERDYARCAHLCPVFISYSFITLLELSKAAVVTTTGQGSPLRQRAHHLPKLSSFHHPNHREQQLGLHVPTAELMTVLSSGGLRAGTQARPPDDTTNPVTTVTTAATPVDLTPTPLHP